MDDFNLFMRSGSTGNPGETASSSTGVGSSAGVKLEMRDGDRGYAVMPDGVGIRYELLGDTGPCVVLIPGGRGGVCDGAANQNQFPALRKRLPKSGHRVLLHDRRNTGSSDVGYRGSEAHEVELQANDLFNLLQCLGIGPAVLVGNSSGGRLSLLLARRHPVAVRGLVLMNLTGGPLASQALAQEYYRSYIMTADGGMDAVARTDHFAALCRDNPQNIARLQDISPQEFSEAMRVSAEWFEASAEFPVLGHSAAELAQVQHPALIAFSMHSDNGQMHSLDASRKLHEALPAAQGPAVAEWQAREDVATGVQGFLDSLPA